jgi:putative peptide zinc metalloprotease protein
MNLSEALDAALPEMPKTRLSRSRPPLLDPDLIVREDVLDGGEVSFGVLQRDKGQFFRLTPAQWKLATLFDGVRSYEEIAAKFAEQTGLAYGTEDVRGFAENMEEVEFWYKTAQEKNLALSQKLTNQRSRAAARKSKISLAYITFSAWDPDRYLGWLNDAIGRYVYSPWCVLAVVLLFAFEAWVFISKWSVIGPDIPLYYNFTHKGFQDIVEFYVLFLVLGFIHESAHGLTCKHFGGQVHSMGLLFMYLMPAFYCDVTEVWVSASRIQRLATTIAGIWIEMVVCGVGMIVWLNTLNGQWIHDFAYQVILITGLAVIVVNLNPLIKLDGYYFLTEAIRIPDLKEDSTAFLTGWFQSRVLRIQADMPVVPRRRVLVYILYALASGAYSYMLLYFVIRFCYNMSSKLLAEAAIIPTGWLAFVMFRSRLRSLRGVLRRIWIEHFDAGRGFRPIHGFVALGLAALVFLPIWRDRENAWYVIEPPHSDTLHAAVPGQVNAVLVGEGDQVRAGQPLIRMISPVAASMRSSAAAYTGDARYQAVSAELRGDSIGAAAAQQDASVRFSALAHDAQSSLVITAPVDGTVLTQNPTALLDREVASGQPLLDLADEGPHVVRVYIPVSALNRIHPGAEVALALPDRFSIIRMPLPPLGGEAVALPQGLVANQDYKGIKLPVFYSARITLPASAFHPMLGVSGQAKIFGERRSLAARALTIVLNLVKEHIW